MALKDKVELLSFHFHLILLDLLLVAQEGHPLVQAQFIKRMEMHLHLKFGSALMSATMTIRT